MQLINNRLERVDIYSPDREKSSYIGTKSAPKLLDYVYAHIQPLTEETTEGESGKREKKKMKLILRHDAGEKCGDLVATDKGLPVWEITEIRRFSQHMSATVEHI